MDRFEEGWEYDAEYESDFDSAFDLDDAEGLYLSLIPDEERQRFWSERIGRHDGGRVPTREPAVR